jgi:hypothetical protein
MLGLLLLLLVCGVGNVKSIVHAAEAVVFWEWAALNTYSLWGDWEGGSLTGRHLVVPRPLSFAYAELVCDGFHAPRYFECLRVLDIASQSVCGIL